MPMDESVRKAVLSAVPSLRAFAISLCGNVDRADDLVQETLLRALANIDSFQPGTNMSAWLFTILRNHFRSEYRKRRREVEDSDGHHAELLKSQPDQYGHVEFREFREALAQLSFGSTRGADPGGRFRFLLRGSSRDWPAARSAPSSSRVNRARTRLAELLHVNSAEDFGPDETTQRGVRKRRRMTSPARLHSNSATLIRPNGGRPRTTEVVQGLPDTHLR